MERTAQCHCGSLRAVVSGEPLNSYVCHCRACQQRTGAIVHSGAHFLRNHVQVLGESRIYTRVGDAGFGVHFHFCPTCGTSVYWTTDKRPDQCGVAVGCFADPTFPAPTISVWEENKHSWLELPPDMQHLELGMKADGTPMQR